MPKFSIIVPVYNTEKYIDKCLSSIENQTLNDYEVIIVNDGSTDNSQKEIDKFLTNEKFKCIYQENKGLSEARNTGVQNSTGEYLIFLDSDDYISYKMCEVLDNNLENDIDVLKFQCKYIYDEKTISVNDNIELTGSGSEILEKLISIQSLLEPAWLYTYKRSFWKENEFRYTPRIYHEDFALTPTILSKASKVKVINDNLYDYVQVSNSITRNSNYDKTKKKVEDMLIGFKLNYDAINENKKLSEKFKKTFNSYLANIVINKGQELNKEDQKEYYNNLKKEKVYDLLIDDTMKRKIKKCALKLNRNIYFKLIK